MERLFPPLSRMQDYTGRLRQITKHSNALLLDVVEDLSYVYSDGRNNHWDPADIERHRAQVIDDLLTARNEFVFRHKDTLLDALGVIEVASVAQA
jgi:small nuclear ribonucleoprotein (snRNP)-like protein